MFQDATFFAVSKYYNEKKRSEVGNYGRYFEIICSDSKRKRIWT